MLKPRRAFEFPSSWNCVAIEQRTQIFANEQIFEIKYKINLSINVSEPDLNPSTNFGFGQNLFPVKRPQICLSFKCFSRSSYSTFSVILSFPLQFWQKLDNISPIALPDLTVIYIFAIIFQQIHILLYHCMIIVTSYMFSSRCIRSIVFIEIHCEYVTFDRCTGLFALLQKDHLAKRSCFWNLFNLSSSARCIWAEKQKNACRNCLWISALLEMEMWRNCKNKRGHLSHLNHELL